MKPIKNRIFCIECQRPKILFESKSKALNFIKYNSDEIKEENGIAPIRTYFCKSCGGWHVTSSSRPIPERRRIQMLIGKAYRLMGEKDWIAAKRFLCYATKQLQLVNERLIPSSFDETLKNEISKAKKQLDKAIICIRVNKTTLDPVSIFDYLDLEHNSCKIDVENFCNDDDNQGVIYTIYPKLLTHYQDKYYYTICGCKLNPDEVLKTKSLNGIAPEDDSIQSFANHSLNMVQIEDSSYEDCCNQYKSVSDYFEGEVLTQWIWGMKFNVLERVFKSYSYSYYNRKGFEYWIKLADRNVHFFLGRQMKYTCYVSSTPIEENTPFKIYKKERLVENSL